MQSSLTSAYGIKHRRYNLGFNINDIANYANGEIPFDSVMADTAEFGYVEAKPCLIQLPRY